MKKRWQFVWNKQEIRSFQLNAKFLIEAADQIETLKIRSMVSLTSLMSF